MRALRAVHARFYLATLPLALAVVGPGLIGATFLSQLEQQMQASMRGREDCIRARMRGKVGCRRISTSVRCTDRTDAGF